MNPGKQLGAVAMGAAVLSGGFGAASPAAPQAGCILSEDNERLIRESLEVWERISRTYLELDPHPLPWMVLFDTSCVWHLAPGESAVAHTEPAGVDFRFAGSEVPTRVQAHDGTVRLPSGATVPAQGLAFASLHDEGRAPFFVMALLDVWRRMPGVEETNIDLHDLFLGVLSHEIVHTRQLVAVNARVEQLGEIYDLPEDLDDDIIEERFKDVPGYREAYDAESDLFYEAVAEKDLERRREIVAEALRLVRARQDRYFRDDAEGYRELDGLFLNMEGVAVWAAYRLSRETLREAATEGPRATVPGHPDTGLATEQPGFERARNTWTQDEGLALFRLIETMVPGWRSRVLGPELASPFLLLEEAVTRPARSGPAGFARSLPRRPRTAAGLAQVADTGASSPRARHGPGR